MNLFGKDDTPTSYNSTDQLVILLSSNLINLNPKRKLFCDQRLKSNLGVYLPVMQD